MIFMLPAGWLAIATRDKQTVPSQPSYPILRAKSAVHNKKDKIDNNS